MAEGGPDEEGGKLGPATPPGSQLTVKTEESDRDSSVGSPEPASTMGLDGTSGLFSSQQMHMNRVGAPDSSTNSIDPAKVAAAAAHLNGTMASMVTLQNLASLQNLPQVASLAAGLQGIAGLAGSQTPLNLSVSAQASLPTTTSTSAASSGPTISLQNNGMNKQQQSAPQLPPPLLNAQQPAAMPQFILASGQLVHGIQGAQLLIPTSQGIATQTILTIPVNHVNSSDQMVNLALNNGQVVTTSLANLQAMAQPHHLLNSAANNVSLPTSTANISPGLLNPATLPHLLPNGNTTTAQSLMSSLPQMLNTTPQPLLNPPVPLLSTIPPPTSQQSQSSYTESKLHPQSFPRTTNSSSTCPINTINRLSSANSEISITTSHGSSQMPMKTSPSSANLSPSCNDNSSIDMLDDCPNQPTINQTSSNVVDGINLDEIKEFAKAFKLRRLSLGLTQTQVGQALSITEGPAYSQSAICSALASQMYCAAQISSQQQAMFEKLDITPKSAQKIKPVLERWMKEAEERYKSGQNHLTDFIGVEPSKKRKRRTSFTPQALELLNAHFERNTHPSGTEITGLAHQLGYEREVIRIWFCNKRQALKNTVRMMSKGMV